MYLWRHQLEDQLRSEERWREHCYAQHEWVQTARGRHQTKEQESNEPWRHPGRRRRSLCLRDTMQGKTRNRCKILDMDYAVENHPAPSINKKGATKIEAGATMSSNTSLQRGHNTEPFTSRVTVQVQIGKDEIRNIIEPQGNVLWNKDRNFANKPFYVKKDNSYHSPQEILEVKHYQVKFLIIIKSLCEHTRPL